MRVLYVAWGFPPHRGPGTYRALATVQHLVDHGHDVTVLTADLEYFETVTGGDPSLLERIDPRVRVVRVPFPPVHRDPLLNRWPQKRANAMKTWRDATIAREKAVFPEAGYSFWRPRVEAAAYRLHREQAFDLCIATGNPYVDFAVPMLLNHEFGVPFLLDDRDSWVVSVYTGEPHEGAEVQEEWLARLLDSCLELWFVNPPIVDWHTARFPWAAERIHVVENGWDVDFLDPRELPVGDGVAPVFGFVGTINAGLPLDRILAGWRLARSGGLPEGASLRLYGGLGHVQASRQQQLLLQEAEGDGVRHMGRWPKTRIAEAYAAIDVLVFAKEGGAMVTSGKVYEYVATGKPIVGVIETRHDARRVLSGYPRAHLSDGGSAEDWAKVFLEGALDARSADEELREAALEVGLQFRRDRILGPALDRVLAAVGR